MKGTSEEDKKRKLRYAEKALDLEPDNAAIQGLVVVCSAETPETLVRRLGEIARETEERLEKQGILEEYTGAG